MARIRTIKPDFFRHESLQDLEAANPGCYVMLVFAGLFGHCDKAGRFEWKPRTLKLDILPFLDFDLAGTLAILRCGGFLKTYTVDGKQYGEIPAFEKHQRINGKEAKEPNKYPEPPTEKTGEALGKQLGSTGESVETTGREGKGREEEGKRKGVGAGASPLSLSLHSVSKPFCEAWQLWKLKQQTKTGRSMDEATEMCQLKELARFDTAEAIAIIEFSTSRTECKNLITNGDHRAKPPPERNGKPKVSAADMLEQQFAARKK
jgi:hypothetical protein